MCFISNVTNNRKKALKNCLKNCSSVPPFLLPVLFLTLFYRFERLFSCFNQFFGSSQGLNFRDTAHLDKPCVSYSIQQRRAGTGLAGKTLTVAPIKIYSKKIQHTSHLFLSSR